MSIYAVVCRANSREIWGFFLPFHSQRILEVFSQPFKEECMSDVVRIISIIIFSSHEAIKNQVLHTCDIIFLLRLQGKFDIDHSWEWKGAVFCIQLHEWLSSITVLACWRLTVPEGYPHSSLAKLRHRIQATPRCAFDITSVGQCSSPSRNKIHFECNHFSFAQFRLRPMHLMTYTLIHLNSAFCASNRWLKIEVTAVE